jgi:uncharacterized protein YdhG (YjbR/CyaY superfamily)
MKKAAAGPIDGVHAVEAYLAAVPEPAQSTLRRLRETVRGLLPEEAVEGFSYGLPAFKLPGGAVCGYAALKEFCSYYPMSGRVITKLKEDLTGYYTSKGAIRFAQDKPLPVALVKKLVKARLAEIAAKKK